MEYSSFREMPTPHKINQIEKVIIKKMDNSISKTRHFITKDSKIPEGIILSNDLMHLLNDSALIPEEPVHMPFVPLSS
jgi:hypothetical protein